MHQTPPSRTLVLLASSVAAAAAVALVACIGEDPVPSPASPPDASASDAGGPGAGEVDAGPLDSGVATRACDLEAPFGAPTVVAGVNTGVAEAKPALSADEKTLYFAAPAGRVALPAGSSNYDVYVAVRSSLAEPFGSAEVVEVTRSDYFDSDPFLSRDGNVLLFSTRAPSNGAARIWFARRGGPNAPFGSPLPVNGVSSDVDLVDHQGQPALTADDRQIWFVSARAVDGGSVSGLFSATFDPATGSATDKRLATTLTSEHDDAFPTLSADGLRIFFASRRPSSDAGASGRLNVWTATRTSVSAEFGGPTLVPELASASADTSPRWLSHDGCRLYLTRSPGPVGADDILVAERPPR